MRVARIIFICSFVVSIANVQAQRLNEFHIECRGWKTLAFAREKSETKDLEQMGIDGFEVRATSHKLKDEQIVYLESCDPPEKRKPIIEDPYWGRYAGVARNFISYEVNGKVFAYRFTYYAVMTKNRQITTRAGAAGDVYYIDEDGDGTFERYLGEMPLRFLPDWLKTAVPKPS
jgi:hypothetical protein